MNEYIIEHEITDKAKKEEYWETGIGLNLVDNLKPSKYLLELAKKNISGELKYEQVGKMLNEYYKKQETENEEVLKEKECDIVSMRIAMLLESGSFKLSQITLKSIHEYLFYGIYDFAGKYRTYNISKKEPVLNYETVTYVDHTKIEEYYDYDFQNESKFDYSRINKEEMISHLCEFVSSIWQVHAFGEGNTRTVAVFVEKYLNTMGFTVDNTNFKKYSLYFRNALVRSNYANIPKGIYATNEYLKKFFENLLLQKSNSLDNEDLLVKELF